LEETRLFEPQLFGLSPSQYLHFANLLFLPTIGFVFLFLQGIPLKKIPLIETGDYVPPRWTLSLFAIGCVFLLILSTTIGVALRLFTKGADEQTLINQYHREDRLDLPNNLGTITDAKLILEEYDQRSNFRIFVNGYRVFGSFSDCRLESQCRLRKSSEDLDGILRDRKELLDGIPSNFHLRRTYELPYAQTILSFLTTGDNFIDIVSEHSGVENCKLETKIEFVLEKGSFSYFALIQHAPGGPHKDGPENARVVVFNSAGKPSAKEIEPYRTLFANPSYRLCERIRLTVPLSATLLHRSDAIWSEQILARYKDNFCELAPWLCR
jgi:hypothetical protein